MDVICKCGYNGRKIIQFQTEVPCRQLLEDKYGGYFTVVGTLNGDWWNKKTLNWACPKCGKVLAQQRHYSSYDNKQTENIKRRLMHNSWDNERWLKLHTEVKEVKV